MLAKGIGDPLGFFVWRHAIEANEHYALMGLTLLEDELPKIFVRREQQGAFVVCPIEDGVVYCSAIDLGYVQDVEAFGSKSSDDLAIDTLVGNDHGAVSSLAG